jgi:hypothetical protein
MNIYIYIYIIMSMFEHVYSTYTFFMDKLSNFFLSIRNWDNTSISKLWMFHPPLDNEALSAWMYCPKCFIHFFLSCKNGNISVKFILFHKNFCEIWNIICKCINITYMYVFCKMYVYKHVVKFTLHVCMC